MAEVMYGLVSEARKNRFSAIPKLTEEGKLIEEPRTPKIDPSPCLLPCLPLCTLFCQFDIQLFNIL